MLRSADAQPRQSTSSNRSRELDFENALKSDQTIYLSSAPVDDDRGLKPLPTVQEDVSNKNSFEDDLNGIRDPEIPAPGNHVRRISHTTIESHDSRGTNGVIRSSKPSLGIDGVSLNSQN
jgi:hypothetical protein